MPKNSILAKSKEVNAHYQSKTNIPLCLSSKTDDLGHVDLISPNRLIMGCNNRRAPTGPASLAQPGRLLKQIQLMTESWWKVWRTEHIMNYVPRPSRFNRTTVQPEEGDIVIFKKDQEELSSDQPATVAQHVAHPLVIGKVIGSNLGHN